MVLIVAATASLWPIRDDLVRYLNHVGFEPHAPDWAVAMALPLKVKIHILSALTALVVGTIIFLQPKGSRFHKTLGWAWVVAMATAAVSSLFITGINRDSWSFIHLLSGWTIISLPMALYAIRNRKVRAHQRAMTGMFLGGLILAGALTFLPGRFFYAFFFG
ncbi:MAG: DUF2306 domain-containing protein [Hyphomonadaceae bacterium]